MRKLIPTISLLRNIPVVLMCLLYHPAMASHIVGGEFTYKYLGSAPGGDNYELKLTIYEDCLNARPGVIAGDDPAILALYDPISGGRPLHLDTVSSVVWDSVPANFQNACLTNPPNLCLLKRIFVIDYFLPYRSTGYMVSFQKCCRNASVINIQDPSNTGSTYFCTIPGSPEVNNSAVYKNYPPQIICVNNPLDYDNSATDADGDSLSYEFCDSYTGGEGGSANDPPAPPPYNYVTWLQPTYYYSHPMTGYPAIQIDPVTGHITGTPNRVGRYLVTVCCHEWRHSQIINTTKREFQFVVTNCSKAVVACMPQYSTDINTYIINCTDYHVHFVNCSTGGTSWLWDFGVQDKTTESTAFEPDFTFPDTGTYSVTLLVNPKSTCADSITRLVKIYPKFATAFDENGQQCAHDSVLFTDESQSTLKPINYWKWNFGDGDSSFTQNPSHMYRLGGTYKVLLISRNAKNCADTALKQVVIENFIPFAGNDTMIVKGEKVLFNASGGSEYTWTPGIHLSDTGIFDPVGFYPDTGRFTYYVHIQSAFGCAGYDTVKVTVVGQAEFFVPNGFSPNGDGRNDIFRPIAVGYSGLKYFRIFNRFGQVVYDNTTLDGGWDGTFNHKQCDLGTYYWEIFFTDRYGKDGFLKGDVTLVR